MKLVKALIMCGLSGLTAAQSLAEQPYSPGVGRDFPRNVYWGDTHLHTRNSADAYTSRNTNLSPDDAYRFARGEELTAHNDMPVRLRRPLDFLVVADHASYLGAYYRFHKGDSLVVNTEVGKRWSGYKNIGQWYAEFTGSIYQPEIYTSLPEKVKHSIWLDEVVKTADRNNVPGVFTAFTGYEWTSMIEGNNLHRVVIFKDGEDKTSQITPFSANDSVDPEDLWKFLEQYERDTGGEAFAIAHNGNVSNGLMFANETVSGKALDEEYAAMRAKWEPLYEVTQIKGDGEAHPILSPNDEFADYETWDMGNIANTAAKEEQMLVHEYARSALKLGLKFESQLGANPFKFGMIGSTDSHTSLATAAEDNFFGKFPESEPGPERFTNKMVGMLWRNWRITSSGYAGIWARENTRASLFEAMRRRETYATTGSRMLVRFFGGWEYQASDLVQPDYVEIAYSKGVPMGGDLANAPKDKAPVFIAAAVKDPDGANLDRVQIVKGWLDGEGELRETIYNVALSDGRKENKRTGKVPAVGSTVDVENASYTNAIGDPYLSAIWEDPEFDPKERAFYYVRVIEIPTPRWNAYDRKYFELDVDDEIPTINQDRAYTSPIWYTP
jgi:hypothetical protein